MAATRWVVVTVADRGPGAGCVRACYGGRSGSGYELRAAAVLLREEILRQAGDAPGFRCDVVAVQPTPGTVTP